MSLSTTTSYSIDEAVMASRYSNSDNASELTSDDQELSGSDDDEIKDKSWLPTKRLFGETKVGAFPKEAATLLTQWLYDHRYDAYPNLTEKIELSNQCKLSVPQICHWLVNARRRILPEMIRSDGKNPKHFIISRRRRKRRQSKVRNQNSSKSRKISSRSKSLPSAMISQPKSLKSNANINDGLSSDKNSKSSNINHHYHPKNKNQKILQQTSTVPKDDDDGLASKDSLPSKHEFVIDKKSNELDVTLLIPSRILENNRQHPDTASNIMTMMNFVKQENDNDNNNSKSTNPQKKSPESNNSPLIPSSNASILQNKSTQQQRYSFSVLVEAAVLMRELELHKQQIMFIW